MKISDVLIEDQNLDEGPIGQAIGKGLGAVARGVGKAAGAAIGGTRALGSALKTGYKAGSAGAQQSILGQTFPDVNLNPQGNALQQPAAAGTAQQAAPASNVQQTQQAAPASDGQQAAPAQTGNTQQDPTASIKAEIDKLDAQGKQEVMQSIQQSLEQPAQDAQASQTAQSTQQVQTNTPQSTQQTQTATATGPQKGQEVTLSGRNYRFLGQQWAEVNPQTGKTGRVAEKGIVAGLNKLAAAGGNQPVSGTPDLRVVQGGQQQAAESYKFESKFLGMMI